MYLSSHWKAKRVLIRLSGKSQQSFVTTKHSELSLNAAATRYLCLLSTGENKSVMSCNAGNIDLAFLLLQDMICLYFI